MITALCDTEGERADVLESFRENLGGTVPFQILTGGRITDWFPSGHASAPAMLPPGPDATPHFHP
jgi:hypothetical protein